MTAITDEICGSLTGCTMYSYVTVGDAHGYKILAFQAVKSSKSSPSINSICAPKQCVEVNISLAGIAGGVSGIPEKQAIFSYENDSKNHPISLGKNSQILDSDSEASKIRFLTRRMCREQSVI